jgi:hypothetical protein
MTPSKIYFAGSALLTLAALVEGGFTAGFITSGVLLVIYAAVAAMEEASIS